jgi:hypothetical protein
MELGTVVSRLLEVVPAVQPKFQTRNRQVLEQWMAGTVSKDDLGRLLIAWGNGDLVSRMSSAQREAFSAALCHYVSIAAANPLGAAYFAVRAAASAPDQLPWSDTAFATQFDIVVASTPDHVSGIGRGLASEALLQLASREDVPASIRSNAASAIVKLKSEPAATPRTSTPDKQAQQARRAPITDISEVCRALRHLANRHLDPRAQNVNEATIRAAEASPAASRLTDLDFMAARVFMSLQRRRISPFRMESIDVASARTVSAYLIERGVPNIATKQSVAFMVLFASLTELDEKSTTPRDVAERIKGRKWLAAFEDMPSARETIIRFGNDYMERAKTRNQLDVNLVVAWLRVYQELLNEVGGAVDSKLREPLQRAATIVKDFEKEETVSFILSFIDPRRARHPWTAPEALPFLSNDQCLALEQDLRNIRVDRVRATLTDSKIVEQARKYLEEMLSDTAYDEFRAPVQASRGFHGLQRPPISEARREYESAPSKRHVQHLQRQWYAYSLTGDDGDILEAKQLWEETEEKYRTYEERWNLAVVYCRIGQERRALELLWNPGLINSDAPYDHLRFAALLALSVEGDFAPRAQLMRILPLAAAHIIAFAAAPPADADGVLEQGKVIRMLASEPVVSQLDTYPNPRSMDRDDFAEFLLRLRDRLVELKLQNTWRIWLTGLLNHNPTAFVLWDLLHQSWTMEDPKRGQEILERGLTAYERWKFPPVPELVQFVRKYVEVNTANLPPLVPRLQRLLYNQLKVKEILRLRYQRVYALIYPAPPPPPLAPHEADPWKRLTRHMGKDGDPRALQSALTACIGELTKSAPDTTAELVQWEQALDSFLRIRESGRISEPRLVANVHQWLNDHPSELLRGFAERLRPFGDWLRTSFADLVRRESLAPLPHLEPIAANPGLAVSTDPVAAAFVISNPSPLPMRRLALNVSKDGRVSPAPNDQLAKFDLDPEDTISVAVPLIVGGEETDGPVTVEISAKYAWGSIDKLSTTLKLQLGRYRFESILATTVKQDLIPAELFLCDTQLAPERLDQLFVGRAAEVEIAQRNFSSLDRLPGVPPYFYGIRRVGKTSLLFRLMEADVLNPDRYRPIYLNLFGLRPKTPLAGVCARLHSELVQKSGIVHTEPPHGSDLPEYLFVEWFNRTMLEFAASSSPRIPVICIDEFHNMVTPQCVPLLDLIRKLYQDRRVLFMLTGWVDHEVLRERASESHLFPLEQRAINFLNRGDVDELLARTFGRVGVKFAADFVDSIVELTAGHPNLTQKLCKYVTAILNRHKRIVAVTSDLEYGARAIVDDGSQFKTSWYNRTEIVTDDENDATKEIIDHSYGRPGAWVPIADLSAATKQSIITLIQKQILIYEREKQRVRIKGLLLDRFLRDMKSVDPGSDTDGLNIGLFVDYENIAPLFPARTQPTEIASVLRRYAESLGNPRTLVAAANWPRLAGSVPIKTAFRTAGFFLAEPTITDERLRANAADRVIVKEIYNRMLEEREGANDAIDVYVIASGDKEFLEYVTSMVERFEKPCRLLAARNQTHLSGVYVDYEEKRKKVAEMRFGHNSASDFVIDDLEPWIKSLET